MSKLNLGSLSDLARILEEASNPDSELREDRRENKPAPPPPVVRKVSSKAIDPKRKAWYEKRLKEQGQRPEPVVDEDATPTPPKDVAPPVARAAVPRPSTDVLGILSSAPKNKPKNEGSKRPESWRRKPGDPIF